MKRRLKRQRFFEQHPCAKKLRNERRKRDRVLARLLGWEQGPDKVWFKFVPYPGDWPQARNALQCITFNSATLCVRHELGDDYRTNPKE